MKVAVVLLAVALAAGCSTGQQLSLTRAQDAVVHISTSSDALCWQGSIGGATHQGCGDADIDVHDQYGMFSSNVQKKDATGATIATSIIVNGDEVAANSTSADYGVAQVIAPLP